MINSAVNSTLTRTSASALCNNATPVAQLAKMKLNHISPKETEVLFADGTIVFFAYENPVAVFKPDQGWLATAEPASKTAKWLMNKYLNDKVKSAYKTVEQSTLNALVGSL